MQQSAHEFTELLQAWTRGDPGALDQLVPLVYHELHRLAHQYMNREHAGATLQTTALLHEAYLRLLDAHQVEWQSRVHFYAVAAGLMRRILVDFARARKSGKRGGKWRRISFDEAAVVSPNPHEDLEALSSALDNLAAIEPRQARVVELRFFGGLTQEETAQVMQVSTDTVLRDWKAAKIWLWGALKHRGAK